MKEVKLIGLAVAILAICVGLVSHRYLAAAPEPQKPIDFSFPDIKGVDRHVSEWNDKVLIVNFWATWCPPCRKEMPEFVRLQNEYAAKNVQFVGIAIDELEPVVEYISTHKINYPILIANEGGVELARELGNVVGALPFTVVINRDGKIVHSRPGLFHRDEVVEVITPLL